jgi:AraC-like DNA-binding protein/TolB-like protein
MSHQLRPWSLNKALDLIESDPAHAWTLGELARSCGIGPRALQQHFRRFVGATPVEHLRTVRLNRARQLLLRAPRDARITEIAARCGFSHLGRFATWYRERYGEAPSATLQQARNGPVAPARYLPPMGLAHDRPAIAVLPFDLVGDEARHAAGLAEEIAAALLRLRWMSVTTSAMARYHLRGTVRGDGRNHLRVTVILSDALAGRMLWADHWDGRCDDVFELQERVALRVARAIEPALRDVEIDRASRMEPEQLNAWGLTMRAMPRVQSYQAADEATALELLERAMELAPRDPLPLSLAAMCRGVRGCLHFTARPNIEKEAAHALACKAAMHNKSDALTETLLAVGYTLADDLATATIHSNRALDLDGGLAWTWCRRGWINVFRGETNEGMERLQVARSLGAGDPVLSASSGFATASS